MIGKVLNGQYKIYDEIGSGGLATVYLARNLQTNQIVAVKVLHAHVASAVDTRSRFDREADLLAGLDDPQFVHLLDHGTEGSQPFLVMEFVEGRTLKELITAQGSLPPDQALYIVRQVAEALASIHRRGVIHRDIKPQNIMIQPNGRIKVMDFGIAKSVDMSTLTGAGFMVGTPHYISPEQAMGTQVDQRSDLYSLGVVFYEMLTGQLLFSGDSPVSVLMKHLHDPVPANWAQRYSIPPAIAELVNRCLAKAPDERYKDAGDFISAIDRTARAQGFDLRVEEELGSLAEAQETMFAAAQTSTSASDTPVRLERMMAHPPQRSDAAVPKSPVQGMPSSPATETPQRKGFPWVTFFVLGGVGLCLATIVLFLALFVLGGNGSTGLGNILRTPVTLSLLVPTRTASGLLGTPAVTVQLVVPTATRAEATPTQSTPVEAVSSATPTTAPTAAHVGLLELRVEPAQPGLWAVVQWVDAPGNWHDVSNWRSQLQGGTQTWEVFPAQLGQGPFRWLVTRGPEGPSVATSEPFYLPRSAGETVRINLSLPSANREPVIQSVSAELPQVQTHGSMRLRCAAVDPEGGPLTYEWVASQGAIEGSGPEVTYRAGGTNGVDPVVVTVSDDRGGRAVRRLDIRVVGAGIPPGGEEPAGKFGKVWREDESIAAKLGWAMEEERSPEMARQEFERGMMLYVKDDSRIYVMHSNGVWQSFTDTWTADLPEDDPALVPPSGLVQPRFGFGKVWREQLRGTPRDPGWATALEVGYVGAAMRFERGVMLWSNEGLIYALGADGTWKTIRDTF